MSITPEAGLPKSSISFNRFWNGILGPCKKVLLIDAAVLTIPEDILLITIFIGMIDMDNGDVGSPGKIGKELHPVVPIFPWLTGGPSVTCFLILIATGAGH